VAFLDYVGGWKVEGGRRKAAAGSKTTWSSRTPCRTSETLSTRVGVLIVVEKSEMRLLDERAVSRQRQWGVFFFLPVTPLPSDHG
jgi:hypothetical protein